MNYRAASILLVGGVAVLAGCSASRSKPAAPSITFQSAATAAGTAANADDALPEKPTLDNYLDYAALHNAGLRAAYYDWVAAVEKVPQAEALPDPRLSYAYYFQEVETRVGAQRHRVGLGQMFPWIGKRALRGDVAAATAEQRREHFEAVRLGVLYRVIDAYAEYYYLARSIEITRENIDLLDYWERLAQAKYRVATGGHPDVIKVQVELGKLADRLRTLEELRGPLVERLNAALNRHAVTPLPWPTQLNQTKASINASALTAKLGRTSPELRALDAAIEREERAIALSKKEYFPDITVDLQWIETAERSVADLSDNGKDPLIGAVSVNLPVWWEKYGAGVREAEARRQAARERRQDRENDLGRRLALALYKFADAERKVDLYGNGLVPKAKESLAATFTAYESGEADFLDVLDAQRVLLDFRLSYERALSDHEQRLAESEMLVGHSLRGGPDGSEPASEEVQK